MEKQAELQEPLFECQIKKVRQEKGISFDALVKGTGISRTSIWRYENGERAPDLKAAYIIANFLGCTIDSLIKVSEP